MTEYLTMLIIAMATQANIDPLLVMAIAKTESNYDVNARSSTGDIGILQIHARTSKHSEEELYDPVVNVKESIKILSGARSGCRHKSELSWVICYNRGIAGGNLVREPFRDGYYKKVMSNYKQIKEEMYGKNHSYTLQTK